MQFKATDEQVKQIAANAINASNPGGPQSMGWLHFNPDNEFTAEDIPLRDNRISLDYVQGRMVKLNIRRIAEDTWEIPDPFRQDYQSFARHYATATELLQSVPGVEIL